MDFPIQVYTIRMGLFIIYFKGLNVKISKKSCTSVHDNFVYPSSSAGPVEMPQFVAFHMGLHCLPKYPVRVVQVTKG